jgi:hypothetical protein
MIFKKFFDYGGHSWGWECFFCKEIIDQTPEIHRPPKEDWNEREIRRSGRECAREERRYWVSKRED